MKLLSRKNKIYVFFLRIEFLICMVFLSGCMQPDTEKLLVVHSVSTAKGIELLQTLHSVYALQNDFQPTIAGSSGLVCILGDITYPPQSKVNCLDSLTGKLNWQKDIGTASGIIMAPDEIYVTYGGRPGVERYDFAGNSSWSRSLTGTSVVYAYLNKNHIQLFMHPERYLLLDKRTGEIVEEQKGKEIIFSTDTSSYVRSFGIESRSKDLSQLYWHMKLPNDIRLAPIFTEDSIFLRTGRTHGSIICVDRKTGDILWETDDHIISNIAYSSGLNTLFALTNEEELVAIQQATGEQSILANFSPDFPSGDEPWEQFEITFDEESELLSVLLGDSKQLFILHVKDL